MKELLAAGANVVVMSCCLCTHVDGFSALHWASSGGHTPILRVLATGADVLAVTDSMATPLHCAGDSGNTAAVQVLLDAGADVRATDDDTETALHRAARGGSGAAVQALISAGAPVGARSAVGLTALHLACELGSPAAVRELLDVKADKCDATWGDSPYSRAAKRLLPTPGGRLAWIYPRGRFMASGDTPLLHAARRGMVAPLRALIKAGNGVSSTNDDGLNALHLAAINGRPAALGLFAAGQSYRGRHRRSGAHGNALGRYQWLRYCCEAFAAGGCQRGCHELRRSYRVTHGCKRREHEGFAAPAPRRC